MGQAECNRWTEAEELLERLKKVLERIRFGGGKAFQDTLSEGPVEKYVLNPRGLLL